jgi:coenzyme F420-0:L-glutamate ligase/coenzyme F420-1:gamma-L-glutamate ligase
LTSVTITGILEMPEIIEGESIADLMIEAANKQDFKLEEEDIVVVTSKIVSKAEGRVINIEKISPSTMAENYSHYLESDPRKVEVILSESKRIVRMVKKLMICETHQGLICANGGVDQSNVEQGKLVLLPKTPDKSAQRIRQEIRKKLKIDVAVIITDTFGRPWREGQINTAIGIAGISPLKSYVGMKDHFGYELKSTNIAIVDEIASAAELVMGKSDRIPIAIVRGYKFQKNRSSSRRLIRKVSRDLFR